MCWHDYYEVDHSYYRHCKLSRDSETGEVRDVVWIPEPYCVEGKVLKIKNHGEWEEGWLVVEVSASRRTGDFVDERFVRYPFEKSFSRGDNNYKSARERRLSRNQ